MAKFVRYGASSLGGPVPIEEYEGDYMEQDSKELVRVFVNSENVGVKDTLVAIIHLTQGQSVRKIS